MPIQDPHATLKRQSGGSVAYKAVPFDEPQPIAPTRKPPVLQQHDRKDFPSKTQYEKAVKAANEQYERENQAYQTEKSQYDKDLQGWRDRKATWDTKEEGKVGQSQEGSERLTKFLKTPEGQSAQGFNNAMLAGPMIPASLLSTFMNRNMRSVPAKIGFGILEGAAGEGLKYQEQQQQPNKYEDPAGHYNNQAWQNFLESSGIGMGLGSIRSALMKKPGEAAPPTTPEPTTPQAPPVEPYKGTTKDVARVVAHDLGLGNDLPSGESKADTIQRALGAIKSGTATPEQIATVTQKAKGVRPETFLTDRLLKSTRRLPGIAGAIGLGAAAAALGAPGEAEAAPREQAVRKPPEGTSSYSSDLSDEYGTGLPKGAAREALKGAAGTALTAAPVVGEALMAAGAPSLYKPSDEDLADAEYWQRGREEMAKPHEASGGAVNPEQHGFNSEHLPEHEKAHLDNPQAAYDKIAHMIKYLRAGSEAVNRGEDFFGGTDQYDKQLAALGHFYHGRPQAQVAPEAETAPEGLRHGGAVNRKVISIYSAFKQRLENQERKIKALEKAHARKSTPKLTERLAQEKDEAKRIREHLERVKMHA